MKTKSLLLTLVCAILCAFHAVAAEGYAVYTASNHTLTFYYGTKPDGAYSLNAYNEMPEWYYAGIYAAVTRVVFDSSFAQAHPISTIYWFYKMENLTTISNWNYLNTSIVIKMKYMFSGCKKLTNINLSGFNTSKVIDMSYMFEDCDAITTLDLNKLNTSNVTQMIGMFYGCSGLTSLNLSKFNTSKVTNMANMFRMCDKLTSLDLSGFNTSNVTDMAHMFDGCAQLKNVNLSSFNTSKVTSMIGMFQDCPKLTSLELGSYNTSKVTDMTWMFYNCQNLKTVKVSDAWSTAAVTISEDMFDLCKSIVGGAGTTYKFNHTDKEYARIDGGPSNPGYFTSSSGGLHGDVNGDGKVNVTDVTTLINMILGVVPKDETRADINGDGKINVSDVTALVNIILGIS